MRGEPRYVSARERSPRSASHAASTAAAARHAVFCAAFFSRSAALGAALPSACFHVIVAIYSVTSVHP